jgi:hypothetical protein
MKGWLAPSVLAVIVCIVGCSGDDGGGTSPGPTVTASFTASPTAGTVLTDFAFDASGSSTSSGTLKFRWDWENDGTWDTDWVDAATASHRYSSLADDQVHTVEVVMQAKAGSTTEADTVEVTVDTRHGQILSSFPVRMTAATGLTADGTDLWIADWGMPGSGRIYKYQETGDTLYSIPAPDSWPGGMAWNGTDLCVTGHLNLYKLDPANGDVRSSFTVVYSNAQWGGGLAWDGSIFYFSSIRHPSMGGDDLIHKYSATGTELGTMDLPLADKQPLGLAHDGTHLWSTMHDVDTLYVRDPDTGDIQRKVYVAGLLGEITILDDYIWAFIDVGPGSAAKVVP